MLRNKKEIAEKTARREYVRRGIRAIGEYYSKERLLAALIKNGTTEACHCGCERCQTGHARAEAKAKTKEKEITNYYFSKEPS